MTQTDTQAQEQTHTHPRTETETLTPSYTVPHITPSQTHNNLFFPSDVVDPITPHT